MCFINKMDRTGADFYFCLDTIKDRLGCTTAVVQLPIGSESNYRGVVDLLRMKAVVWSGEELGATFDEIDIPEDMVEQAELYRSELIDTLSTFDENILEKFVGEEPITAEDLRQRAALRHHREPVRAHPQRHRVQEQGRPAVARRRHRLHAVAGRPPAGRRARPPRASRPSASRPTTSPSRRWRSRS